MKDDKFASLRQGNAELEQQLQERTAQLQEQLARDRLLFDISLRIRESLALDETLKTIVQEVQQLLECDRVLIYQLLSDCTGRVVEEAARNDFSIRGRSFSTEVFPQEYYQLYRKGRIRAIDDVEKGDVSPPCLRGFMPHPEAKAKLVVPIIQREELWGLLVAHDCAKPRHWQPSEIDFLEQLATHIAIAVQQAALYEQAQNELIERQRTQSMLEENNSLLCATLDSTNDGILIVDTKGKLVSFNHTFVEMWNLPDSIVETRSEDIALELIVQQLKEPIDFIEKIRELYKQPFAESYELLKCKNDRYFELYSRPQFKGEESIGRAFSFRDVTLQKAATDELLKARDRLEIEVEERTAELTQSNKQLLTALEKEKELVELKNRFITMASHDFRTPLATILNSSELLKIYSERLSDDKKLQHLNKIQAQVKNMTILLDEVLFVGKLEAGHIELNPVKLNLADFCQYLIDEISLCHTQTHSFVFECCGEYPLVEVDENLMRRMLSNLLSNAIKYSPKGGTVNLKLRCNDSHVIISIQDQGIGIPTSEHSRLFEVFHRSSNVGKIPGTGLGMAIIKQVVEIHGGSIAFESEVGVGTTFTVCIPMK